MLEGKVVVLGVTGSIAAYKAANIIRLLVTQGAEVKIVMTPLAKQFITPLTLATLAKNPIYVDFFNRDTEEWLESYRFTDDEYAWTISVDNAFCGDPLGLAGRRQNNG